MKRCPQCLFIYPDSDTRCDFDNTPLVVVDEAELDAATTSISSASKPVPRQRRILAVAGAAGLVLAIIGFLVYLSFNQRSQKAAEIEPPARATAEPVAAPSQPSVSPSPAEIASPSPSPSVSPRPSPARTATSHSGTTFAPVSTSGPGMGKRVGGKPVILLTSGGKIDADEVWRTGDGVWYRRHGIVTLLKRGQVKAIVNQ